MFLLVTLQIQDTPDHKKPWYPLRYINNNVAQGLMYGKEIDTCDYYSETLRDLVLECLYEKPGERPKVKDLKARVEEGWRVANAVS